ncbi:hypothetical protein V6N11_073082 [Hibiscus sabdariffa]|uniref:Uncharacterized protein n=1 Tax=Hibiscus sabdariffa TaxID=183260 RepID=A0ABR2NX56_9ROSI
MDYSSLPHFCRKEGSGSTCRSNNGMVDNCFSLDHAYHQQLYSYVKQQAILKETGSPVREGSVHVEFPEPDPDDTKIALTIESELHKLADRNSLNGLKVSTFEQALHLLGNSLQTHLEIDGEVCSSLPFARRLSS